MTTTTSCREAAHRTFYEERKAGEGEGGGAARGRPKGGIGTTDRVDVPKIPQTKTISYNLFIIFSIEYDGTQI